MPKLFEITDEWSPQPWYSTGGTRAKKYLQSPDGKFYYFKRSQYKDPTAEKPGKDFKYEFWSEVIAFELGTLLGFNVLRYDIATDGEIMGCISESMINSEEEELVEGVKYLRAFSKKYKPELRDHRKLYTFQMIEKALRHAKLNKGEYGDIFEHVIETIIFDALIGNGDRHQENWAIISRQVLITDYVEGLEKELKLPIFDKATKSFLKQTIEKLLKRQKKLPKSFYINESKFAPIYDSGSSLGRELLEEKVELFLLNNKELAKYIEKGPSEIHWEGKKISHFELIHHLLETNYKEIIQKIGLRIIEKWNDEQVEERIRNIDEQVPVSHKGYKIPDRRKDLIIKLIKLRKTRLEELLHEGV